MAKPNRLKELEAEYKEPLESLIPRLLEEFETIPAVAQHLSLSVTTLWQWLKDNGYERKVIWVKKNIPSTPLAA